MPSVECLLKKTYPADLLPYSKVNDCSLESYFRTTVGRHFLASVIVTCDPLYSRHDVPSLHYPEKVYKWPRQSAKLYQSVLLCLPASRDGMETKAHAGRNFSKTFILHATDVRCELFLHDIAHRDGVRVCPGVTTMPSLDHRCAIGTLIVVNVVFSIYRAYMATEGDEMSCSVTYGRSDDSIEDHIVQGHQLIASKCTRQIEKHRTGFLRFWAVWFAEQKVVLVQFHSAVLILLAVWKLSPVNSAPLSLTSSLVVVVVASIAVMILSFASLLVSVPLVVSAFLFSSFDLVKFSDLTSSDFPDVFSFTSRCPAEESIYGWILQELCDLSASTALFRARAHAPTQRLRRQRVEMHFLIEAFIVQARVHCGDRFNTFLNSVAVKIPKGLNPEGSKSRIGHNPDRSKMHCKGKAAQDKVGFESCSANKGFISNGLSFLKITLAIQRIVECTWLYFAYLLVM
ncbi:hypothetical protein M514_02676 [Trichuris suis]|uniref:Uncharacterized protein n=1 Tax=Trichuris suis TaxID=68888 RepID=A0A085NNQ3_9BILA|nr:hypothetical protein M514_02676 [Trichuris suis]